MALNAKTGWGRGSIFGRRSEEGSLNRDGVLLAPESACRAPFLIVWGYRSILPGRMLSFSDLRIRLMADCSAKLGSTGAVVDLQELKASVQLDVQVCVRTGRALRGRSSSPLNGLRLYRKAGPGEIVRQGAHILKRAQAEYKKLN
jgi:hypothetical protein